MHIPDGLMDPLVILFGWMASLTLLFITFRRYKRQQEGPLPLMALLGGSIFAAQMLNFPVAGGTTGHLVGAALAAILLGPEAALLIMTTILLIQAFLMGDGGVLALGLNILNMGVLGVFVGWFSYMVLCRYLPSSLAAAISAWAAVFIGAAACATELAISYTISGGVYGIPGEISFPSMLFYHAFIGVGEGVITSATLHYLEHTAPEILKVSRMVKKGEGVRA